MFEMFLSHPGSREDIAGNLRGRLGDLGVNAWVYSYDRFLAADSWEEIRRRIEEARVMAFPVSKRTTEAEGQRQELDMALNRVKEENSTFEIFPILIDDDVDSHSLPEPLRRVNGERLSGFTVASVALKIARQLFPETVEEWTNETRWRCPRPGDWLEVCGVEGAEVEEYFELGDRVYFRTLSPLGLLQCYAPKINDLFWFYHADLRPVPPTDPIWGTRERELVPKEYSISTRIEMEALGWDEWNRRRAKKEVKAP